MLRQTLFATLAAGVLAVAALPTAASAGGPQPQWGGGGYFQFGGPGWNFRYGTPPPPPSCRPIIKKVKWWDQWNRPHWSDVVVGQDCTPRYPHPPRWGWGGGWNNNPPPVNPGPPGWRVPNGGPGAQGFYPGPNG